MTDKHSLAIDGTDTRLIGLADPDRKSGGRCIADCPLGGPHVSNQHGSGSGTADIENDRASDEYTL